MDYYDNTDVIEKSTNQLLDIDLNLPNNIDELNNVNKDLEYIKKTINRIVATKAITSVTHELYYDKVVLILLHIGDLSKPCLELNNKLEDIYFNAYRHTPSLAKKLWQDHYEKINRPYNHLKNKCFRLLEDLDQSYYSKFKMNPPNWDL